MRVKIKKKNKQKTYKLIESWSDVTLEKWLRLVNLEEGSKAKEAEETIAALSDIPKKLIRQLSVNDVAVIMSALAELQAEEDTELKKVFEIEGVKYGMHPDLDSITLGEYADIETFIEGGVENNLPEIMAVLFRPVIEEESQAYTITAYDGNINVRAEIFKKMPAEQVQSALVFFWHLGNVLYQTLPLSLMARLKQKIGKLEKATLQKNGDGLE